MSRPDFLLTIDGIQGESKDDHIKNAIELSEWGWSVTNSGSHPAGGGGGAGQSTLHDFYFKMHTNGASPNLMLACASGQHIAKATLTCRKAAGDTPQPYLIFTFTHLVISSFTINNDQGSSSVIPLETITFNYKKIEMEYKTQDEKGAMGSPKKVGWDQSTHKKV